MMTKRLAFFLFVINIVNVINGNFPLPAITPEYCNATEFYDPICVRCKRCGGKDETQANLQHRGPDGSCTCKSEYKETRNGPHSVSCEPCPTGKLVSSDGKSCLSCSSSNPYNETTGNCEPCTNGVLVEDGKEFVCLPCQNELDSVYAKCSSCLSSSSSSPSPQSCALNNKVFLDGICVSSASNEPSHLTVKFENGISVLSSFFINYHAAALEKCKEDDTFCQVLANMCVMTMYKISIENNICAEFRKLSKKRLDECKPRKQLWLFYIEDDQRDAWPDLHRDNVPNVFAPYPAQKSQLHIYAMKYAMNGTFLGLFKVTSDMLNLCPESDVEDDIAFTYGTQLQKSCKISLQRLWKNSELVFYDLYLAHNDSKSEFYPIPVLIRGISVNGEFVNKGPIAKWLLVRRFFLTDHISGIENGTKLNRKQHQPVAKVFRYASDVSLRITARTDGDSGTIYPPLLIVTYSEAVPEDYMRNKKVTVKFSVVYKKDQSSVMQGVMIAHIVLGVFAFIWSSVQTYSWFRRSDKHAVDFLALGKFMIFMCGNFANASFIILFCVCLKWFIFFKKQDVIYTLLPTAKQEQFLSVYLGVAFTMKAFQLIHLLAVQCNINIFFIDWERPRVKVSSVSGRLSSGTKNVAESSADGKKSASKTPDKINTEMAGVSIWRTYFAANEWAEIQSKRKLNVGLQVFGVLFFLKVLDFEDYALAGPNFNMPSSDVKKYVPYSICCRFALGASVYLSIALLQIIFQKVIYERFIEDKLQQYVDLCSVSNVSVFILLTKRFGYYIHGRSAHGKADVNMKEMHEFLRKEEEDLCGHRGLIPNTEQQTFQIVLPSGVHDQFLRLLVPLTSYSQAADRMQGVGGRLAKVDIDRVANTHYMLNKFLSGFIEHSFKDLDYVVKDKVLLENLFDIECYEVADRGYFYNDDGHSFSAVLFYGNESTLLLFDVLLFSILDIASANYVLSTILTGLIAKIIMSLRRSAGRRNLVRKALVDERFLT